MGMFWFPLFQGTESFFRDHWGVVATILGLLWLLVAVLGRVSYNMWLERVAAQDRKIRDLRTNTDSGLKEFRSKMSTLEQGLALGQQDRENIHHRITGLSNQMANGFRAAERRIDKVEEALHETANQMDQAIKASSADIKDFVKALYGRANGGSR